MFKRLGMRLLAALMALSILTAAVGCMPPQRRGGEEQEEKGKEEEKGGKEEEKGGEGGDKGGEKGGGKEEK